MAELPEDWQNVPNEKEKSEEIKRLTVRQLSSVPFCCEISFSHPVKLSATWSVRR